MWNLPTACLPNLIYIIEYFQHSYTPINQFDDFLLFQWNLDIPKLFHNEFIGTDSIPICDNNNFLMWIICDALFSSLNLANKSIQSSLRIVFWIYSIFEEINNSKIKIVSNKKNHSGRKDDVIKEHDHF